MMGISTIAMLAARRIPLPPPPTETEEQWVERVQAVIRQRVGQRLKRLRTEAGLSLRGMEARVNVSASYLSEIERALNGTTIDLLARVACIMGVPITFFFEED
jgi:hypothetical protein